VWTGQPSLRASGKHGLKKPLGSAAIHAHCGPSLFEQFPDRELSYLVLGKQFDGGSVLQIIPKGHRLPGTAAVSEAPWNAGEISLSDHCKDRSDSDPASNKQILARRLKTEVVAGSTHIDQMTRPQTLMNKVGYALARRLMKHCYLP
jgi:hypothetical protein